MESVTLKDVTDAVDEAEAFPGGLCEFLFVTAADRDSQLQADVRAHYRATPASFPVELVFWSDITVEISSDDALVAKHWKGFGGASSGPTGSPSLPARRMNWSSSWKDAAHLEFETALWSVPLSTLDVSELSSQVEGLARAGRAGFMGTALVRQNPNHDDSRILWSLEEKPYSNVTSRWELEVNEHGVLVFRWGERTTGDRRYVNVTLFFDGIVFPTALYKSAIESARELLSIEAPSKFVARLTAHGNGPLLLNDDLSLTSPSPRMAAPEAAADWKVEVELEPSLSPLDSGRRLLNRALGKFKLGPHPRWLQGEASSLVTVNEQTFKKLYGG